MYSSDWRKNESQHPIFWHYSFWRSFDNRIVRGKYVKLFLTIVLLIAITGIISWFEKHA
jgi:hypothetical protein